MTATVAAKAPQSATSKPARTIRWWVEVVAAPAALDGYAPAWDDLAWHAVEPNPFYERWNLQAAWQAFGLADRARLALVFRDGPRPDDPPQLAGLFPLAQERVGGSPLSAWTLWHTPYTYNCTPLLRQGMAHEALTTFWDWLQHEARGPALWMLPHVNGEGPFHQALIDVINRRRALCQVLDRHNRAILQPAESAEAYCAAAMTSHNRQELRRQFRRLGEMGTLEFRASDPQADLSPWAEEFLALEAAGWKGREQSALAATPRDAEYFRQVIRAGAAARQVAFLGLYLAGRPIALKVNYLSGEGSFAFKIAFDESLSKFSPGVQLELENIAWLHRQPNLKWMDSCAKPDHFMINRLWRERRTGQRLLVSAGRIRGDLLLGLVPLGQALRRVARRLSPPARPQSSSMH
jgi:hypothetical protein